MVVKDLRNGGSEVAPLLAELGYDYIELSLTHLTRLINSDFNAVKKTLMSSGIPCESCNNFFPPEVRLTGPDADLMIVLEYARRAIERAAELGVSIIVFGSGPAKKLPDGFPKDQGWRQLITLCQKLDPIAGSNNITIVLEPLRKEECNIINSIGEAYKLMLESDTENIKILVDYFHSVAENESSDILLEVASNIRHVHMANPENRSFPKSWNENLNYKSFFENLKKIGYDAGISVEAFSDNFHEDAKGSINFLNQIRQSWF
jgi:D-psicose/D-tagatose/L-ribulose 3-epimerase